MINNYFMERTLIAFLNKSFSSIGLGCVTFGREIDQQASYSLMDYAVEKGITFFDTASAYGDGASEKIICKIPTVALPGHI